MSDEIEMTPEERALFNSQTMDGSRDRTFCGIKLLEVTAVSSRYIERQWAIMRSLKYTNSEMALAYAYLLTLPLNDEEKGGQVIKQGMRSIVRDINTFEKGMDAFVASLPYPLPVEESQKLGEIVNGDFNAFKAAQVQVVPKPDPSGATSKEAGAPPNS